MSSNDISEYRELANTVRTKLSSLKNHDRRIVKKRHVSLNSPTRKRELFLEDTLALAQRALKMEENLDNLSTSIAPEVDRVRRMLSNNDSNTLDTEE